MILIIRDDFDEELGRLDIPFSFTDWQPDDRQISNTKRLMVPIERTGHPVSMELHIDDGVSAKAPLENLEPVQRGDAIRFEPGKLRVDPCLVL